jgi:hypothetical protein
MGAISIRRCRTVARSVLSDKLLRVVLLKDATMCRLGDGYQAFKRPSTIFGVG